MSGSAVLYGMDWYSTDMFGHHLNKLVGFSTDIFQDDRLRLAWRPGKEVKTFDIFAYVSIGGKYVRQNPDYRDKIATVNATEAFYFDIKHNIPDMENPEDQHDRHRLAYFAVNGRVVVRHYPVTPGLIGWVQNFRFGGVDSAPWAMFADVNYELNKMGH